MVNIRIEVTIFRSLEFLVAENSLADNKCIYTSLVQMCGDNCPQVPELHILNPCPSTCVDESLVNTFYRLDLTINLVSGSKNMSTCTVHAHVVNQELP